MPYMSYHNTKEEAVKNAARFIQEGKADAVKLEGGFKRKDIIEAIISAEIPVMGHLGLTPQSKNMMGGYKVQGKTLELATQLLEEAVLLETLGCFSMVLEGVPSIVAEVLTEKVSIPIIGIGAGANVDGQVLVLHDMLGVDPAISPKFFRKYANTNELITHALDKFHDDVMSECFPAPVESYK